MSRTPEYLKRLRENVNWEIEQERNEFVEQLYPLVEDWHYQLPRLRDIFRKEEIEYILWESIKCMQKNYLKGKELFDFVLRTGYQDEPEVDEDNKLLHRTTMVHHVMALKDKFYFGSNIALMLILHVYNRFDVIYSDESGMTHFHVACMVGSSNAVARFLDSGRDPNCPVPGTGDTPLLLALKELHVQVVELLLRSGADPNSANAKGLTPLHVVCKDGRWWKQFFEIIDDIGRTVHIDPRDNFNRTPLQWAVAYFEPTIVDALLERGADLSRFVFPTAGYFGKITRSWLIGDQFYVAFRIPMVVAILEKRGYEFSRSDALIVMQYFAQREMFLKPANLVQPWHKKLMIRENLSLYDVIQLQPKEALKLVKFEDYRTMKGLPNYWAFPARDTAAAHLCEKLSRGFLKRWALEPFMELTHYRLPILCCEMIIDNLSNEDLFNICQAAAIRTKRKPNSTKKVATNVTTTAKKSPVRAKKAPKRLQHK